MSNYSDDYELIGNFELLEEYIESYQTDGDWDNWVKELSELGDSTKYDDLLKENKLLKEKLSNAVALKEESFRQEDRLLQENKELKRKRLVSFNNGECWVYSEEEPNYLRTLVCPVVLSPIYLQELQELLWESAMWLGLTLDEDEPIWDTEQSASARLCLHSSKDLLKGFCKENDGGYR